jgi:hypothetical protein
MVDPQVSRQFFEDHGAMKRDIETIKESVTGPLGLAARVGAVEQERHTNIGRKDQSKETRTTLLSMIGAAAALLASLYNLFRGNH